MIAEKVEDGTNFFESGPMSNPDSTTAFPATENHPIFVGDSNGECSVEDFIAHMPESEFKARPEVAEKKKRTGWRVFWTHSEIVDGCWEDTVDGKIKDFLEVSIYRESAKSMFIQFWAPTISSSGQNMLTVLEKPFGMGTLLNGFCRYRYGCMKNAIQVEDNIDCPVGRAFTRGCPEYSERIEFYSKEEFPMMDLAKFPNLRFPLLREPQLFCDNNSAIFLAQNPVAHKRAKHIDIDYHFVRELVAGNKISISHVPTSLQIADIFTKGLNCSLFDTFRSKLCVSINPTLRLRGVLR